MIDAYRHIDDYILNRLSPQEVDAFEDELDKDNDLLKEVESRILVLDSIEFLENDKLKLRLKTLEKSSIKHQKPIIMLAVAASIILLIVMGFFVYKWQLPAKNSDLFAEFYEPYPLIDEGTQRGNSHHVN